MKGINKTNRIMFMLALSICLNCSCINRNGTAIKNDCAITESDDSCFVVTPKTIDLGKINNDVTFRHKLKYELINKTDSTIKINKIDVSCGCVKVTSYPDSVLPYHTETITAEIDLTKQRGSLRKIIFVNYDNGQVKMAKVIADIKD